MNEYIKKYIGGLDVGTTGCKIAVYADSGKLFNTYYTEYASKHSKGLHEIDFNDIKSGVIQILKQAASECYLYAVGVTSFGETFAMLDDNDNILSDSMLYTDPRGDEECRELCTLLGEEKMTSITGVKPNKMYSISKIMWHKINTPEIYRRCTKILLGEDFIVYTLTGRRTIDYSLAARTGAFNIAEKKWCREIFDAAGVSLALMSEPVESGTYAGLITEDIKKLLGISYDIKVINCCHDQVAAMIGSGVFEKGIAMDGTGTVECIPVIFDAIPNDPKLYDKGYSVVPYVNGKYACYALSFTGGATLKWFRDNFAEIEKELCSKSGKNVYAYLDSLVPKSPTNLLILPYFAGAATPYMDTDAKAAFIGVTLETTKYDIYRALMEGTSYEILLNFNELQQYTGEIKEIRATGGGATSDVWLQIKADILNTKIYASSNHEIGAAGTAALAGVAAGVYSDLKQASEKFSDFSKVFLPSHNNAAVYAQYYEQYKNIYKAVKNL